MRNKNSKMILMAALFAIFTIQSIAQSHYRPVKFFYVNGMNTTEKEAKREMEVLKKILSGYNPELIYSKTAGLAIDAATIIDFQDEMRECSHRGYKTAVIKDNCKRKKYFKEKLVQITEDEKVAAHIVSYSRGNIFANVVMEELDYDSDYYDTYGANMRAIRRINIASPGRIKYGSKFTTKRVDKVIGKFHW